MVYIYATCNPDLMNEVLVKQASKFKKDRIQIAMLRRFLGNGLTANEGESWRRQRRLIQPAFHSSHHNSYVRKMVEKIAQMRESWENSSIIELHQEMVKVTLHIVTEVLFGADAASTHTVASPEVYAAMDAFMKRTIAQQVIPITPPSWLPNLFSRSLQRMTDATDKLILDIIQQRRAAKESADDLLTMLLQARDEDGSQMTDQQVHDEVLTLLMAGHDTTANSLSWTWYLLAQNPECQAQLREEVDRVLDGRLPTIADLQDLHYTNMIVKESLRLYPSVWLLGRQALEDVTIGNYQLAKDSIVIMSPYVLHRDPRWFDEPERFLPERFTEENEQRIPPHAYLPFGSGPRMCMGNRFATMEQCLILAMVAQQYELSLVPGHKVEVEPLFSVHPKYGMRMQLRKRERVKV